MLKTIIFDFDGTIGNTQQIILRSMQATIRELALPARTDLQCAAMIGLPLTQCFTNLYPDYPETVVDAMKGEQCAATYRRLFKRFIGRASKSPLPPAEAIRHWMPTSATCSWAIIYIIY